ncbi:hypothetical protein D3C80_1429360 [compost metagenome]
MPTNLRIDTSPQPQCIRSGRDNNVNASFGVIGQPVRVNDHYLALSKVGAVLFSFCNRGAVTGTDVSKRLQLLREGCQLLCDRKRIQTRRAKNTRLHAGSHFGNQQGKKTSVTTVGTHAADHILGCFGFVRPLLHANDNGRRAGLLRDGGQHGF